jgi:hypothetical protein
MLQRACLQEGSPGTATVQAEDMYHAVVVLLGATRAATSAAQAVHISLERIQLLQNLLLLELDSLVGFQSWLAQSISMCLPTFEAT